VAALHGAVPLAHVDGVPKTVDRHLDLHMAVSSRYFSR